MVMSLDRVESSVVVFGLDKVPSLASPMSSAKMMTALQRSGLEDVDGSKQRRCSDSGTGRREAKRSNQGGTESVRVYKERPTVLAPLVGGTWGSVYVRIGGRFRIGGGSVLGLEACKGLRERSGEEVRWKSLDIVKAFGMKESSVAEHTFHEQETFEGVRERLGLEPRVFDDRNYLSPSTCV